MTAVSSLIKKVNKLRKLILLSGLPFVLLGCASTPQPDASDPLFIHISSYADSLPTNHPDLPHNLFEISDEMRTSVRNKFTSRNKHKNASDLAHWLVSEDGHNMVYELEANLAPADAYANKRGNCLSFTLLLIELANELDIELRVNQVDLPDTWGEDEQKDLIFYRHVNAVYKTPRNTQIFDLAMQDYRPGYPQRLVAKEHAAGLLFSNIGIQKLQSKQFTEALHYLKLAASLFPKNADMWINLAAAYRNTGKPMASEKIYLHALSLRDKNSLAASNLARLYKRRGETSKAARFEKMAARGRRNNPYIQYQNAQSHFENKKYKLAKRAIKRAISLHDYDPQFYELSSLVNQSVENYKAALLDLQKAHSLSTKAEQRERYYTKVQLVAQHAIRVAQERQRKIRRRDRPQTYPSGYINGQPF